MTDPIRLRPEDQGSRSLESLVATAPEGATIALGAGTFVVRAPLVRRTSLHFVGEPGTVLVGDGLHELFRLEGEGQAYGFTAIRFEGGGGVDWGGAFLSPGANTVTFDRCRFSRNQAKTSGGVALLRHGTALFKRCIFERNRAARGGALDVGRGSNVTIDRCIFFGHEASVGGAIFLNDSGALTVQNCTFVNNQATYAPAPGGHALFVFGSKEVGPTAFLVNSLFVGLGAIGSDAAGQYDVSVESSVVPLDGFRQPRILNVRRNLRASPALMRVSGLAALIPGEAGTGMADLKYIAEGYADVHGRPLVRDGLADVGAIARP